MGQLITTFCGYTVGEIKGMEKRIAELEEERDEHEMAYETIVQALNKCYDIVSKDKNNSELSKQLCLMIGYTVPSELLEIRDLEQEQKVISRLNSYLIKRANEIGECLPMYLVDHIKEFKGGAE